jgi:hypothetical protein
VIVRVTAIDVDDYLYDDLELIVTGTSEAGERVPFYPTRGFIEDVRRSGEALAEVVPSDIYNSEMYGGLYPCPGNASALEAWAAEQGHGEWCNDWMPCDDPGAHEEENS